MVKRGHDTTDSETETDRTTASNRNVEKGYGGEHEDNESRKRDFL